MAFTDTFLFVATRQPTLHREIQSCEYLGRDNLCLFFWNGIQCLSKNPTSFYIAPEPQTSSSIGLLPETSTTIEHQHQTQS
jgi:hypothetical protein